MILSATTQSMRIVLGEAATTNPCQVVSSWAEIGAPATFQQGNTLINTNGTTPVTVVAAPSAAGLTRDVREVRLFNADTVTHTVTLQIFDGSTAWAVAPAKVSVPANGAFVYTPEAGITVVNPSTAASGITVVDGNGTTINGVTSLTLAGPTVTGSTPNATATLVPRDYISGLQLTVASTTSFQASAGQATSADETTVMNLGTAITKLTGGTWVAGNNQNGLDTGTIANSTWYHAYVIFNPTTLVTDVLFSLNATTPTLPSGFTKYRRIFSFQTGASTAPLIPVVQNGDRFDLVTPVLEFQGTVAVTTAVTQTLSAAPTGIIVEAIIGGDIGDATNSNAIIYISSLQQTDSAPSGSFLSTLTTGSPSVATGSTFGQMRIVTNTSAQIRRRNSVTTSTLNLTTYGWIDRRGKQ